MRHEAVKEYLQTRTEQSKNTFHHETDYAEAPASKAPTPQERMRRETVKEYRQAKAEQSKNAFHHETDYTEAPAPKLTTPQERMRRETIKEYRQAKAEQSKNTFHHETHYVEAPPPEAPTPKVPTPQERMRREAVKEYRLARAKQSKNAFHHETDYAEAPVLRAEKPQKQMFQSFLEEEKETAPLLQAGEAPALSPIKNEAESAKPRLRPKKREVRESVKTPITVTGQRQTALPRNTWRFSLTKPLVLPGVDKKALANKTPKYKVMLVCRPHQQNTRRFYPSEE